MQATWCELRHHGTVKYYENMAQLCGLGDGVLEENILASHYQVDVR